MAFTSQALMFAKSNWRVSWLFCDAAHMQELCDCGSLYDVAAEWDLQQENDQQMLERLMLLRDAACGLEALHQANVVHGDLVRAEIQSASSHCRFLLILDSCLPGCNMIALHAGFLLAHLVCCYASCRQCLVVALPVGYVQANAAASRCCYFITAVAAVRLCCGCFAACRMLAMCW
jgi:hypothetical protein